MFNQSTEQVETGRSRVLLIVFGIVIAAVVGGVLLYSSLSPPSAESETREVLPNVSRAGDPVFEEYKNLVQLQKKEYFTQPNMLGQITALGTGIILNLSDKTITGVELRGKVIGKDDKLLATTLAYPVPRRQPSIPPRGQLKYTVSIRNVPNDIKVKDIYDISVELEGLVVEE